MKKLLLTVFSLFLFNALAEAQAPQAFKYQAVVRDAGGQILPDQQVGLFIELAGIDTIYSETHTVMTNSFGLVNLEIGRGTPVFGIFSEIDWNQQIYIVISLDATGGTNYETMGVSELLSVPFALHAANAGNSEDADADPTNELQDWTTLPGIPADIADGDQVDDADADPVNEIQVLSQDGANVTLSKDGGTISVNDADADATNELELPTDAEAGDIVYHDGTQWQRIPKGGNGQVLTMGTDGIPFWNGLIGIILPDGQKVFFAPTDIEGTGNIASGSSVQWGPTNIDIPNLPNITSSSDALADLDGETNTAAIVAALGDYDPPTSSVAYAAKLCDDLVAFGYDDWYLPAAGEIQVAIGQSFLNLDLTAPNGAFIVYQTSTEASTSNNWVYDPANNGLVNFASKNTSNFDSSAFSKCRCVRRD